MTDETETTNTSEPLKDAKVAYILFLLAYIPFLFGIPALVSLAWACASDEQRGHSQFLIQTFQITLASAMFIGFVGSLVKLYDSYKSYPYELENTLLLWLAFAGAQFGGVLIWSFVRCISGLKFALDGRPVTNPNTIGFLPR